MNRRATQAIQWLEDTSTNESATYAAQAIKKLEQVRELTQEIIAMIKDDYSMKDMCFVERLAKLEELL